MKYALFSISLLLFTGATQAASVNDYYKVENIAAPKGAGSADWRTHLLPDGRLAACFHRGEVYIYAPKTKHWTLFADGLHEPLGIVAEDNHMLVTCNALNSRACGIPIATAPPIITRRSAIALA